MENHQIETQLAENTKIDDLMHRLDTTPQGLSEKEAARRLAQAEVELRCVHWDTKHHQDRMPTLQRFLDQCAALKINAVLYELEDKFEYPSHPIIGAPGAFTTAELQALTDGPARSALEAVIATAVERAR